MFGAQSKPTYRYMDGYPKYNGQPRSFVGEFTVNDPIDEQIERLFLNHDDAVIVLQESRTRDQSKQRQQQQWRNDDVTRRREQRERLAASTQAQNSFATSQQQQQRSGRRSRSLTREQDLQPRGIQVVEDKNAYRPASVILINRDRVKPGTDQQQGPHKQRSLSLTREQQHVQPQRGIQIIEDQKAGGQGQELKEAFSVPVSMAIPTITISREEKLTEYNVVHHKAHSGKRSRSLTREQEEPRGIRVIEDTYNDESVTPIVPNTSQNRLQPQQASAADYYALQTPFRPKDWRISYEEELKLLRKKQFSDKSSTSERPPTVRFAFEMVENNPQLLAPPRDSFVQSPPPPLPQLQQQQLQVGDSTAAQHPVTTPDTPQQQSEVKVGSQQQMWQPASSYYSLIMQHVESEPSRGRPRERVITDTSHKQQLPSSKKQSQAQLHQQQRKEFSQQLLQHQQQVQQAQQQASTAAGVAERSLHGILVDTQRSTRSFSDTAQTSDSTAGPATTKGVVVISLPDDKTQQLQQQQQKPHQSPNRHRRHKHHHTHYHSKTNDKSGALHDAANNNSTSRGKTVFNGMHKGVSYDNVALQATKMTINTLAERRYRDDMAQLENICAANYSKASHHQASPRTLVPPAQATSLMPKIQQQQQQPHHHQLQQYADPFNSTHSQHTGSVTDVSPSTGTSSTDVAKQLVVLKEIFI